MLKPDFDKKAIVELLHEILETAFLLCNQFSSDPPSSSCRFARQGMLTKPVAHLHALLNILREFCSHATNDREKQLPCFAGYHD
jgi:hypothetical protein